MSPKESFPIVTDQPMANEQPYDYNFLIDTHCHLDFKEFAEDLPQIIERAKAKQVNRLLSISVLVRKHGNILNIAEAYDEVYCSLGTHPLYAQQEADLDKQELIGPSNHAKIVAFGECGLDYHQPETDKAVQKAVFREHIFAAQETNLPIIVHARDADEDLAEMLVSHSKEKPFAFVLHCYSSGEKLARTGLELGGYISFSGIVTFKNAKIVQNIASFVPLDKILVETDAPYLAPVPYRGKRNEPSFVYETAQYLAKLRDMDFAELQQQTSKNAFKLFYKMR